jgi:uracil-DNA glycosylase
LSIKQKKLDLLKSEAEFCNSCTLVQTRTNTVWDNGNPNAEVVIIAEAPGKDEDEQGLPLIGRCGKLIEQMLNGVGLKREDTWRLNCLCCRPPENRDPLPLEIEKCNYFMKKQVEIIKPKVLILLGKFAAQTILKTDLPIGKLVNQWYEFDGQDFVAYVMYHPSFILRNGDKMIESYQASFKEVKDLLDESKNVDNVPWND